MFPSSGDWSVSSNSRNSIESGKHTAFEASDNTALKATVLPMLMSETIHTKTAVATIALAGTWKCGLTLKLALRQRAMVWQSKRVLTVPSHLENGRPSSRAKANIWRELEAKALMVIMTRRTRTTLTKPVVPPTLSVAFWKT